MPLMLPRAGMYISGGRDLLKSPTSISRVTAGAFGFLILRLMAPWAKSLYRFTWAVRTFVG